MMNKKNISIAKAWNTGFALWRDNLSFLFVIIIFALVISWFPEILIKIFANENTLLSIIIRIAGWLLQTIIQMDILNIVIKLYDYGEAGIDDLFSNVRLLPRFAAANILYMLIILLGLVLFIVPGIILYLKFQFYNYLIIDKKMSLVQSFKESAKITSGAKWDLLLFALSAFVVNMLGMACFFVGLLVTIPATTIAGVYIYKTLLKYEYEQQEKQPDLPEIISA
ncbi:MAG: hypothetical protein BWY26_00527 [Elusimicrobia bacterium ADurb.Bin231]|nr:MAG: hypothetical protein BWY26_00527 [Elusimicrobia bacterium ADurb.Bin231]